MSGPDTHFSYDGEDYQTHANPEKAREACQRALDYFRDGAGEGWDELVECIAWGPIAGRAVESLRVEHLLECDAPKGHYECAPECEVGGDWDSRTDYELRPVAVEAADRDAARAHAMALTNAAAARRVLRHLMQREPLDSDVAELAAKSDRDQIGHVRVWLAFEVAHRARGLVVPVPAMPAAGKHAATPAFVQWCDEWDEHHYSGPTLAWALIRALASLLEAEIAAGSAS